MEGLDRYLHKVLLKNVVIVLGTNTSNYKELLDQYLWETSQKAVVDP